MNMRPHYQKKVVDLVIGGGRNGLVIASSDQEIRELCECLAQLCQLLLIDCSGTRNAVLGDHLFNVTLETAQGPQKEALMSKLSAKLQELEGKLKEIDAKWQEATLHKKKEGNYKGSVEKIRFYKDKSNEYHEKTKSQESYLTKIGFNHTLDDTHLRKIEKDIDRKKHEIIGLREKMSVFEGIQPNNDTLAKKIKEMKEQLDNYDDDSDFNRSSLG